MRHQPGKIANGTAPYAAALISHALAGSVAIYAGAGLSVADPTHLPSGAEVARDLVEALRAQSPALADIKDPDLLAVADVVELQSGGQEALRLAAAGVAEFTTAEPSYGHRLLAILLMEGILDVLTTNWDDCIERGWTTQRIPAVVKPADLLSIAGPSVLKIHGCASQPGTLLVSSADLRTPPVWVKDQTRARLQAAIVVFLGIGDVAGYVQLRLQEALDDVGSVDNVRVVSPSIVTHWDDAQWSTLTPTLRDEHRIAATADSFLEQVANAYVTITLAHARRAFVDDSGLLAAFDSGVQSLNQHDSLTVLTWCRSSGVVAERGKSVMQAEATADLVRALGRLCPAGFELTESTSLRSAMGEIDTIIAVGLQPASRLRREAEARLEGRSSVGKPEATFLVAGGRGWAQSNSLPADILGDGRSADILDGPLSQKLTMIRASEV
jgi:hypothetical protein